MKSSAHLLLSTLLTLSLLLCAPCANADSTHPGTLQQHRTSATGSKHQPNSIIDMDSILNIVRSTEQHVRGIIADNVQNGWEHGSSRPSGQRENSKAQERTVSVVVKDPPVAVDGDRSSLRNTNADARHEYSVPSYSNNDNSDIFIDDDSPGEANAGRLESRRNQAVVNRAVEISPMSSAQLDSPRHYDSGVMMADEPEEEEDTPTDENEADGGNEDGDSEKVAAVDDTEGESKGNKTCKYEWSWAAFANVLVCEDEGSAVVEEDKDEDEDEDGDEDVTTPATTTVAPDNENLEPEEGATDSLPDGPSIFGGNDTTDDSDEEFEGSGEMNKTDTETGVDKETETTTQPPMQTTTTSPPDIDETDDGTDPSTDSDDNDDDDADQKDKEDKTSNLVTTTVKPETKTSVSTSSPVTTKKPEVDEKDRVTPPARGGDRRNDSRSRWRNYENIDLSTRVVYRMKAKYHRCDDCMENFNSSLTQCPYYANHALEFDKWAKQYSDMLKFGCHAQGRTEGDRCCHTPLEVVDDTISQMAHLAKSLAEHLKDQCNKCPIDCEWGQWGDWSLCPPATCEGQPRVYRTRTRALRKEQFGGRKCVGQTQERKVCPTIKRVLGVWHEWAPWTVCSGSCGGTRTRKRTCTDPTLCFTPCKGDGIQAENCGDPIKCCKDPVWTEWGAWEQCMEDGVTGSPKRIQKRRRMCQPDPAYPDALRCPNKQCWGRDVEERACEEKCSKCVRREWSTWGEWGACYYDESKNEYNTAAGGQVKLTKARFRKCEANPRFPNEPMCPDPCPGSEVERDECCTASVWDQWGAWSPCTSLDAGRVDMDNGEPCGSGVGCQNRTRKCIVGTCGDICVGDNIDHNLNCLMKPCCEPPVLTEWGQWEECQHDRRNGRSLQTRRRQCQPKPDKWEFPTCKKKPCSGALVASRPCKIESCTRCATPNWGSWGAWGRCDFREQSPSRARTRECVNPSAGDPTCQNMCCAGSDTEKEACICDRSSWSTWSTWSSCSYTTTNVRIPSGRDDQGRQAVTGARAKRRQRQCMQPVRNPEYCRDAPESWRRCAGQPAEEEICCDPETFWGQWKAWSPCENTQQGGVRSRSRSCEWVPGCKQQNDRRMPRCDGRWSERQRCQVRVKPSDYTAAEDNECAGRVTGEYASQQKGCNTFIVCCNGVTNKTHTCPRGLHYDSVCGTCLLTSRTCNIQRGGFDVYKDIKDKRQLASIDKSYCVQMQHNAQMYRRRRRNRHRTRSSERSPQSSRTNTGLRTRTRGRSNVNTRS